MGYVRYVGRVGALAVALGVGSAVATMPASRTSGAIGLQLVVQLFIFGPIEFVSFFVHGQRRVRRALPLARRRPRHHLRKRTAHRPRIRRRRPIHAPASCKGRATHRQARTASKTDELSQESDDASSALTTTSTVADDSDDASSTLAGQPSVSEPAPTRTVSPTASAPKADVDGAAKASSRSASSPASTSSMPQGNPRSSASTLQSPSAFRLTNTTSSADIRTLTLAAPAAGSSPIALAATSTETVTPQAAPPTFSGPAGALEHRHGCRFKPAGVGGLGPIDDRKSGRTASGAGAVDSVGVGAP